MIAIPYMGSKRKLAKKIVDKILMDNPNCKYFFDLFGGGGAISFEALKRKQLAEVHYNELNTGVVELLRKIINDGVTPEFYQWIDRETFHEHKNDKTWFGGLLATCWSFGGNQRTYLFSKENEELKKPLHEYVLNRCGKSVAEFKSLTDVDISIVDFNDCKSINERRLKLMKFIKKEVGRIDLEQLQSIQQLQQLQRLQQLAQIEQLEQLEITNQSYIDVHITTPINETIIYLDPPYFNTAKYQEVVCHNELMNFIKNSPYRIYVSNYEFDLPAVDEYYHRSTLSATANNKIVEKLFCNQEYKALDRLF